jgi:hypothetical protein
MKESLWSERVGVYGEYRDRFGLQLLHESPDLSSIYTPIDLGFCDQFEAYRMLRFALRRFETVRDLPRGGALIYSSEWLPNHYSTRDIYTAEIINTLLALYQTGQAEAAEPFRRAIDGSCFAGPGPGSTGYVTNPNGTYKPHTDFTDTTSMYVRNVVEGLFGVRMNAPERRLTLQPCFPKAWDQASIQCPFVDYQYSWDGTAETMVIKAPNGFGTTIRLRARRAEIASVTVNGRPAEFSTQPGVGCAWVTVPVPAAAGARVQVVYGKEALPQAEFVATGTPGQSFTVRVDRGRIKQVRLSRSALDKVTVSDDGKACVIPLPPEAGVPTFFVRVAHGNTESWVPVEVDVRLAESVAGTPAKEDATNVTAHTVDLSRFHNQRLADLHKNKFEPLITPFYWANREGLRTIQSNGRIWWEGHAKHGARPNTTTLASANGRFTTDNGIPFDVPASGEDSVFTTRYENFPNSVEIPVNLRGRKVCFLIAASIPLAQSRMENGRITVKLGDGTGRVLTLRNPESIDDWLGSGKGQPYVQSGKAQSLGNATHAVLQELDLGEQMTIKSVTLETRTEETMIGLLGITVIQEGESK